MRIGRYQIVRIPRSVHGWHVGRRPHRIYVGPIMLFKRDEYRAAREIRVGSLDSENPT